jgi:hypothetical protein
VPDIAPAQIDAGAAHLSVHIAGADLVEVLVDGLTVENHLLHARFPRFRLRLEYW